MQEELIKEFNSLGIPDMGLVTQLQALPGDYINLVCQLPNGQTGQLLDDQKTYFGAELCKPGSDRCYGLAADEDQLLVYEYGEGGKDAVLVLWKRRDKTHQ